MGEFAAFGATDIGKARADNQDQFMICSLHKQMEMCQTSLPEQSWPERISGSMAYLFIVADGVGGSAGGAEASSAALNGVASYATHTIRCYYTQDPHHEDDFLVELGRAVVNCHEELRAARSNPEGPSSGATTLTLVAAIWPRAYVVQVGDSRFYLLHDGVLRQVTKDQTVAQELVDQGILTQSHADRSPLSDVLSSAVGGSEANPVITTVDLHPNDTLLLCTDGLTRHVSDDAIRERLLQSDPPDIIVRQLVRDALDGGGHDNITAVVGRPVV